MLKKEHKFFEGYPNIDLQLLDTYLHGVYEQMKFDGWFGDPSLNDELGMTVDISPKYNIFKYRNKEIEALKFSIIEMLKEASEYYGYDFNNQKYIMTGWFNFWRKLRTDTIEEKAWHFHDKVGAPHFHGYYCVNAEPSITYYMINDVLVENHNKNNRAILSETNHAHAPGDWLEETDRITIAYDIVLASEVDQKDRNRWIELW